MKVLLAITGASGVTYGVKLLEELSKIDDITVNLVISNAGKKLIDMELEKDVDEIVKLANHTFEQDDLCAPPSSGSSLYDHMLIVPCSLSTLSKVSSGMADNLITRAASVMLKERRGLLIVPRETPLSTIHLENMVKLSREGCIVLPACPGFYSEPKNIDELVDFVVGKILDTIKIDNELFERWT